MKNNAVLKQSSNLLPTWPECTVRIVRWLHRVVKKRNLVMLTYPEALTVMFSKHTKHTNEWTGVSQVYSIALFAAASMCGKQAREVLSTHTPLSAYDITKTCVVGDDYERHRWQCTTSLSPLLNLYRTVPLLLLCLAHMNTGITTPSFPHDDAHETQSTD
jgi:hypothetical protein